MSDIDFSQLHELVESHEKRITRHGEQIDMLDKELAEIKVHDQYRDQSIQRIEGKLDKQSGKMDSITVQIGQLSSQPAREQAETWRKVRDYVITLVIGIVIGYVALRMGLK